MQLLDAGFQLAGHSEANVGDIFGTRVWKTTLCFLCYGGHSVVRGMSVTDFITVGHIAMRALFFSFSLPLWKLGCGKRPCGELGDNSVQKTP